jgi:hypothetical protein
MLTVTNGALNIFPETGWEPHLAVGLCAQPELLPPDRASGVRVSAVSAPPRQCLDPAAVDHFGLNAGEALVVDVPLVILAALLLTAVIILPQLAHCPG